MSHPSGDRTTWWVVSANRWLSVVGKQRDETSDRPDPPEHDHLLERGSTAKQLNELGLTEITEHAPR